MMKLGLIGSSLEHSFSKDYFEQKFKWEQLDAEYQLFELENDEELQKFLERPNFDGCNVTIPYKVRVIPFLDELSPSAKSVGAVNTVVVRNGNKIGYNTDVIGFQKSIQPFLKHGQHRALILGTGGASSAVAYVLNHLGLEVFYLTRNPKGKREFSYADCNDNMINSCKLIVNTTPLGTYPNVEDCPDLPFEAIDSEHLCYDLIYNPEKTKFLQNAELQGATIVNGLSMLKIQAEASWDLWVEQVV